MDTPKVKSVSAAEAIESATDDDREPTKEEILEDLRIRIGIIQAKAGLGRPARESLEELRREIYGDADSR